MMFIKIDFKKVIEVADKKHDGWNITPDMISECVVGSRFLPTNERAVAIMDVEFVVNSVTTRKFDECYTLLLLKYHSV